jgi:FkbM family methyltransferase
MTLYEKMQFRFTKFKIRTGLPLNQHDCKRMLDHYLAVHNRDAAFKAAQTGAFRVDLGKFTVHIRKDSSDMAVIHQVIVKNQYGPLTGLVRHKYPGKIDTIIDAGANIGLATLHLKRNFPEARIISLEPDQGNYQMLLKNIAANQLTKVVPLKAGLWRSRKHLKVVYDTGDGREWSFSVEETAVEAEDTVAGYGISDLMHDNGWEYIDILKIDIEGAERFVFEEDGAVRSFLARTRFLAIEIHDQFVSRAGVYAQLRANGFEYFDSGELTIAFNAALVK